MNVYQKIYPLYDLEAYRVSAILLYHLVGLEVWRNAEQANILRANEGLIDPAPIIAGALKRIDPDLVFTIGFIPSEIAYHKNRRWSFCGRDVVTNSEIKSDIALYANVLKQNTKGFFIMASKLSKYRASADSIKNYVGQIVVFLSSEFAPNKFNEDEQQAKARIMTLEGEIKKVYCTPNVTRIMEEVDAAGDFPVVARVVKFPPRQKGQSEGYGIDDKDIPAAMVKKLEQHANKLKDNDDDTEELDQNTGKWKKVKSNPKAPQQKAKKTVSKRK